MGKRIIYIITWVCKQCGAICGTPGFQTPPKGYCRTTNTWKGWRDENHNWLPVKAEVVK